MATFESMADGMDVKGKVVVCTGGGSGMGREMCIEAAKRGASAVVPVDFNLKGAEETVARIKQYAKCIIPTSQERILIIINNIKIINNKLIN